ncbi:hypothetical protein ES332_A02G104300v1 [Gossypium tomentosum]|uniref:Uncharacterized protein n=1 Tax=Gossypium tomentosum TaxID=34277 RepID=A0A5D2RGC3_GOSTO|nr:hypothetical protein ES332_A02G104300v1 [Gossypium tomentosum]
MQKGDQIEWHRKEGGTITANSPLGPQKHAEKQKKGDREFSLLSLHSPCPAIGFPEVHCAAVVGQWPALRERIFSDTEEANEGAMRRVEEATVRGMVAEVACAVVQHAWGEQRLKREARVAKTIWVVGLGLVLGLLGLGL